MNFKRPFVLFLLCFLSVGALPVAFARETPKASAPPPMLANQPLPDFRNRRERLMAALPDGLVVARGGVEESLGVSDKFFQSENFFYLTGVEIPGSFLILNPFGAPGAKSLLFIPRRNPMTERWTGPQLGPGDEAAKLFGADKVLPSSDFQTMLAELCPPDAVKQGRKIYLVEPGENSSDLRDRNFVAAIRERVPGANFADGRQAVHELRKVKTEGEIALLQKAIDITGEAQRDVRGTVAPGKYEYELEALILAAFYRNGAERVGFPCIVGSGLNATTLHYNKNRKKIAAGDLVVVDIGAQYSGYTADITRTYPANGKFTPRQREIYNLVLAAQEAAAKSFKPGESRMSDLNLAARDFMRASPLRAGNNLTLDNYFLHGLGHFIGLNVHDVGDYGAPLPVGSVITIEPGIYIPDENIGVRIEDDYLVTEKGLVKLSRNIPFLPEEIERMMKK